MQAFLSDGWQKQMLATNLLLIDYDLKQGNDNLDGYNSLAIQSCLKGDVKAALALFSKAIKLGTGMHVYLHYCGALLFACLAASYDLVGDAENKAKAKEHAVFLDHWIPLQSTNLMDFIVSTDPLRACISKNLDFFVERSQHVIFDYKFEGLYADMLKTLQNDAPQDCLNKALHLTHLASEQHFYYHQECSKIYYNRALCFFANGDAELALNDITIALDFDKKNPLNQMFRQLQSDIKTLC